MTSHRPLHALVLALAGAWVFSALVLAVALLGRYATGLPFGYFTRDPAAVTEARVYVGLVSVVGIVVWWTGAVAMGFGAWHARLTGADDRKLAFAVATASIAYLALDDAFQLHENVYVSLGISDHVVELAYVGAVVFLIVVGRHFLATTDWQLLVVAGGWFAVSVAFDLATDNLRYLALEDGAKLLGIATLTAYCLRTAALELAGDRHPGPESS